jgi:hypothetical protein
VSSDQSEAGRQLLLLTQIREVLGADRFDQ